MALNVRSVRVDGITIEKGDDTVRRKISGGYSLMSDVDSVIAKQRFNGYDELKVEPSTRTLNALEAFIVSLRQDISALVGIPLDD